MWQQCWKRRRKACTNIARSSPSNTIAGVLFCEPWAPSRRADWPRLQDCARSSTDYIHSQTPLIGNLQYLGKTSQSPQAGIVTATVLSPFLYGALLSNAWVILLFQWWLPGQHTPHITNRVTVALVLWNLRPECNIASRATHVAALHRLRATNFINQHIDTYQYSSNQAYAIAIVDNCLQLLSAATINTTTTTWSLGLPLPSSSNPNSAKPPPSTTMTEEAAVVLAATTARLHHYTQRGYSIYCPGLATYSPWVVQWFNTPYMYS